jgi:hypothetical protein
MRDYNFFEIYKRKTITTKEKTPVLVSVIAILMVVGATVGIMLLNAQMEGNIKSYQAEIEDMKSSEIYMEAERLESNLAAMKEYDKYAEKALEKLDRSHVLGSEFMSTIASVLPINTSILAIQADQAYAHGDFLIPNRREGAELILALKQSGLFSYVHANNIFQEEDGGRYIISIVCDLKVGEIK